MEILKLLKAYSLFRTLSEKELRQLAGLIKRERYQPGQPIFNWGERGGKLYLIKKGVVEISLPVDSPGYGAQKVSLLSDGCYFGELSFLDGNEHSARATAVEETELLVLDKQDYERFMQQNLRSGVIIQERITDGILNILRVMNKRYSRRPFLEQYHPLA
jgi:CRP-like cAMP-binding protein